METEVGSDSLLFTIYFSFIHSDFIFTKEKNFSFILVLQQFLLKLHIIKIRTVQHRPTTGRLTQQKCTFGLHWDRAGLVCIQHFVQKLHYSLKWTQMLTI